MRVPLSWLRSCVELPQQEDARRVGERFVRIGLKVEGLDVLGADLTGPVVVGRVLAYEELTGFKKSIRWCQVDVGEPEPRGVVCGAANFAVGDRVVVALPGAVLPGGFAIGARKTYGHVSDGMICSARELGVGEDSAGILVLPPDVPVGTDAVAALRLRDEVLDLEVTPDRGYCLSMRGVAREAALAYDVAYADPAVRPLPEADASSYPVRVDDPATEVFVAMTVTGVDPAAPSPLHVQQRLRLAGMRPISLVVDVTNYVMLELGQPLAAYDRQRLQGPIVARRAHPAETLETLDGAKRELDPEDLVIADDSGPIGIAGVMGGASTEIGPTSRDVVIESARFDPVTFSRTARRHRLHSEAARRFARGVDPALQRIAAQRAVDLLVEHGGGRAEAGVTVVGHPPAPAVIRMPVDLPARVAGYPYTEAEVAHWLDAVGCRVRTAGEELEVEAPSWRPDLTDPYDLVEEVARLHGYDAIPAELPRAPAGRGLTRAQRARRQVGRALAAAGYVEAPSYPFVGTRTWDALGLDADDPRRRTARLANPLSDGEPELRTTLLPGLLATLRRNLSRGAGDLALFETGVVFRPRDAARPAPHLPVDRRPTDDELAALDAALPQQPRHVGAVLVGHRELPGWWGPGRRAGWVDAVDAAREVGRILGLELEMRTAEQAPWHPGRCAAVLLDGRPVGHAGELHPRVLAALDLPPRTAATELDLDALVAAVPDLVPAPHISTFPVATQDVALIVDAGVPAADVQAALVDGAGPLLESIRLFDLYRGPQVGEGRKSLAYALRFRAFDRTLTDEEAGAARDAAVAEAHRRTGAALRGG